MKTVFHPKRNKSRTFFQLSCERGSALIYVLIAVALFAALTLALSRQNNSGESGDMTPQDIELATSRILSTAGQIESAVQQMTFSGGRIDDLDFTLPGQADFNTPPNYNKVFHPEGGGVTFPQLDSKAKAEISSDPPAGWYIGRFSNVEWSETPKEDIILTAHQISEDVCAYINEKLTGSTAIPALSVDLNRVLIDTAYHGVGQSELNTTTCADCDGYAALCVSNNDATAFGFYSLILSR